MTECCLKTKPEGASPGGRTHRDEKGVGRPGQWESAPQGVGVGGPRGREPLRGAERICTRRDSSVNNSALAICFQI